MELKPSTATEFVLEAALDERSAKSAPARRGDRRSTRLAPDETQHGVGA